MNIKPAFWDWSKSAQGLLSRFWPYSFYSQSAASFQEPLEPYSEADKEQEMILSTKPSQFAREWADIMKSATFDEMVEIAGYFHTLYIDGLVDTDSPVDVASALNDVASSIIVEAESPLWTADNEPMDMEADKESADGKRRDDGHEPVSIVAVEAGDIELVSSSESDNEASYTRPGTPTGGSQAT